ncbi:hypothetical protein [Nonomuraea typhae]|uniref:hypothetical protein n=1 Tax=Nonomuraea typhae TaxID=2603600 RepID=UPI0012F7E33B|nr:hypothetical protein [Nonomuraea typhae]
MFKRRIMTLAAVGVLGLAALAGSAMADELPAPGTGGKIVCTDENGKVVAEFTKAVKAIAIDKDGKVTKGETLPRLDAAPTVTADKDGKHAPAETVIEFAEAVPAQPAEAGAKLDDESGPADGPVLSEKGTPPGAGERAEATTLKCEKVD